MNESHSGHNISIRLDEIIRKFEIKDECVHIFLRDAASSMICAVEELGYEHFDCFCHKIQLVIFKNLSFIYLFFLRHFMMDLNTNQKPFL